MRRPLLAAVPAVAALCLSVVALASPASAAPSGTGVAHRNDAVCGSPATGSVKCDAVRHDTVDANGRTVPTTNTTPVPGSYGPGDIQSAYKLTGLTSGGRTVAIVDAYHDPNAEADLAVYRSQYKLSTCDSSGTTPCFQQVNQTGGTTPPAVDTGWAQEISLDMDMVSATCPDCHILLVETNSSSFADLTAGVNYAASQGAVVAISNSYGGNDTRGSSYPAYFNAASLGIAVTASTGDSGYGAQSPASFPGVVAVGGTSLTQVSTTTNSRGWTETAWSGAGSGCSRYNAKPSYQTSATKCSNKADADVSAVADPNTGVAVYDSTPDSNGNYGWMQFGGTSASSPIIASVYALAGGRITSASNPLDANHTAGILPWSHTSALNDVQSGSNGHCATKVWCTATGGWDGPTGLGTPNGTGAF